MIEFISSPAARAANLPFSQAARVNEVYLTYFQADRLPARSAFGTAGLALGARVEIECLASG